MKLKWSVAKRIIKEPDCCIEMLHLDDFNNYGNEITDQALIELVDLINKNCKQLFMLHINGKITNTGIVELTRLSNLTILSLFNNHITDQGVASLADLTQLFALDLSHNQITYVGAEILASNYNLQILRLCGNKIMDRGAAAFSANLGKLFALDLSSNLISDVGAVALSKNSKLKILFLCNNKITDLGTAALANCNELLVLKISHNRITDLGVLGLSRKSKVRILSVANNQITDQGAWLLAKCSTLFALDLSRNKIHDSGVEALALNHKLDLLSLDNCYITDVGAKALASSKLRFLSLDNNSISDIGARFLATNNTILELSLQATEKRYNLISDIGVKALAQNTTIINLSLIGNTRITAKGLIMLHQSGMSINRHLWINVYLKKLNQYHNLSKPLPINTLYSPYNYSDLLSDINQYHYNHILNVTNMENFSQQYFSVYGTKLWTSMEHYLPMEQQLLLSLDHRRHRSNPNYHFWDRGGYNYGAISSLEDYEILCWLKQNFANKTLWEWDQVDPYSKTLIKDLIPKFQLDFPRFANSMQYVFNLFISGFFSQRGKYIGALPKDPRSNIFSFLTYELEPAIHDGYLYCLTKRYQSCLKSSSDSLQAKVSVLPDGLTLKPVPKDGHCFYHAVAIYLMNEGSAFSICNLRDLVATHLENNLATYNGFFMLPPGKTCYDYIDDIRNSNEWAGELEIIALSKELNRSIVIIDPNGQAFNPSILEEHLPGNPIFVYYDNEQHYDALPVKDGYNPAEILNNLLNSICNEPIQLESSSRTTRVFSDQAINENNCMRINRRYSI